MTSFSHTFGSFPWAKLIYSVILLGIILLFFIELKRLWFDSRLYVGRFQVFESGVESPTLARTVAVQILHHHRRLLHLFEEEKQRRSESQEDPIFSGNFAPILDTQTITSDIELSVQGINVKDLLSKP